MNITEQLNRQIANFQVLNFKLHHYHWRVSGPHFFTLHAKFEEWYDRAAAYTDDLAERVLALQGEPPVTLQQCLGLASLKEAAGGETAEQMVRTLAEDVSILISELKETAAAADEAGDRPTADMLTNFQTELEKDAWMLRAFLA